MKSTQTVPTLAFCSVATGPSRSDFSTVRHGRVSDMRILLLAGVTALFLATGTAHPTSAEPITQNEIRVVDGDTVRITGGVRIRLTDYDSPELFSPKCPCERELAWKAKLELERIIGQVRLELVPCATHNYGRLCAEGTIDEKPLAAHMVALGLGSSYVCWTG